MLTAEGEKPNPIFPTAAHADFVVKGRDSQLKHARNLRDASGEDNRATPARAKAG
jgi:hypothetical protein